MAVLHVLGNIVVEKWGEIDCRRLQLGGTVLLNFAHIPAPGQDIVKADDDQACVGINGNMMQRHVFIVNN